MAGNGGPPNKFPTWVTLTGDPGKDVVELSTAYSEFYVQYHYWPTVAVTLGNIVYLGAYGE